MSKIICDVCGTSYPETASQCPICGCVRPADAQAVALDATENESAASGGYTYVKGGRFSKANVRKRNRVTQSSAAAPSSTGKRAKPEEKKSNKGLIITAVILLLAIVAVFIYIILHFFGPTPSNDKTNPSGSSSGTFADPTDSTPYIQEEIPCEDIVLDVQTVTFDKVNTARVLNVKASPDGTTDEMTFVSSNEAVASVTADGKITAIAPGQAVITVTCGSVVKEITVECVFEEPTEATTEATEATTEATEPSTEPQFVLALNRFDITFKRKGDSWVLYDGNISVSSIKWSSADTSIATFTRGKVVAVGSGTTTVYAEYEGQKVSCIIRCSFTEAEDPTISGSGGGITEDGGDSSSQGNFRTVTSERGLNIRSTPSTSGSVVGSLSKGDKVEVLETKTVGNSVWGRISNGWICLDYTE